VTTPSPLRIAILTVSDTRTLETDKSGGFIADCIVAAGHALALRRILPDDLVQLRSTFSGLIADASIDVVACHQVAHHFQGDALAVFVREMHRVARHRVIISDLRRSWVAAAGIWTASFPLRFHPVSRHDGVLSVLRGFTVAELRALVYESCGVHALVCRRAGFRLTASWAPPGPS